MNGRFFFSIRRRRSRAVSVIHAHIVSRGRRSRILGPGGGLDDDVFSVVVVIGGDDRHRLCQAGEADGENVLFDQIIFEVSRNFEDDAALQFGLYYPGRSVLRREDGGYEGRRQRGRGG